MTQLLLDRIAANETALFWERIHEVERRAIMGERPRWTEKVVSPLAQSHAMIEARSMLDELASAGSSVATQLAMVEVQRAIDELALAVASDMLGS